MCSLVTLIIFSSTNNEKQITYLKIFATYNTEELIARIYQELVQKGRLTNQKKKEKTTSKANVYFTEMLTLPALNTELVTCFLRYVLPNCILESITNLHSNK